MCPGTRTRTLSAFGSPCFSTRTLFSSAGVPGAAKPLSVFTDSLLPLPAEAAGAATPPARAAAARITAPSRRRGPRETRTSGICISISPPSSHSAQTSPRRSTVSIHVDSERTPIIHPVNADEITIRLADPAAPASLALVRAMEDEIEELYADRPGSIHSVGASPAQMSAPRRRLRRRRGGRSRGCLRRPQAARRRDLRDQADVRRAGGPWPGALRPSARGPRGPRAAARLREGATRHRRPPARGQAPLRQVGLPADRRLQRQHGGEFLVRAGPRAEAVPKRG